MASVKMLVVLVNIAAIVVSLSVVDALTCKCSTPEPYRFCEKGIGPKNVACDDTVTLCFKHKQTDKQSNNKFFEGCFDSDFRSVIAWPKNLSAEDGKCIPGITTVHTDTIEHTQVKFEASFCSGDLCIPPPCTEGKEPDKGNETDKGNEPDKGKEILKCNCSGKLKGRPLCPGGLLRSEWTCNESDTMCFKARTVDGAIVEGCFNSSFRKYAAKYMVTPEAGKCYYDPVSTEEVCWCDSTLCVPPDFKEKGKDKDNGSGVLLRSWSWIPLSILASSAITVVPSFVGGQ